MDVASGVRGQVAHLARVPVRAPERRRAYLSRTIPLSHPIRNEIIRSKTPTIPRVNVGFNSGGSVALEHTSGVLGIATPGALRSFPHLSSPEAPSLPRHYPLSSVSGRRRRPAGLASVRRSNGSYSFPVSRFHSCIAERELKEGTSVISPTSPYSPRSLRYGSCCQPLLCQHGTVRSTRSASTRS